jgi:hypothetical protein
MFPEGGPGIALLVLRICAAVLLLTTETSRGHLAFTIWLMAVVVALGAGVLTPVAYLMAGVIEIMHPAGLLGFHGMVVLLSLVGLAVLGPGAYSLDARLFGRRRIIPTDE